MIESRMAPRTRRTHSVITSASPSRNTSTGHPGQEAVGPDLDRHRGLRGVGDPADEAGVDEADEGDEQADADRDGDLELRRYGVEDRRPEARQHQTEDHHTLDHDQPHRVGPAHLPRDRDRDEGVEPEAGRQRQRVVGDRAHQDRHHAGHQRRTGRDRRQVGAVTGAAAEEVAVLVGREPEDDRVEHHDVGHREEGDDAAAELTLDGRPALADAEPAVEPARRTTGVAAAGVGPDLERSGALVLAGRAPSG